jgi:hypothetical protein
MLLSHCCSNLATPRSLEQGCQMAYFQTNTSDLDTFGRTLEWKKFAFSRAFGIIYVH